MMNVLTMYEMYTKSHMELSATFFWHIEPENVRFNPNPIGLFEGLESMGGPLWPPPPQISATQEPIDLKLGTDIKQVEKNKNQKEK